MPHHFDWEGKKYVSLKRCSRTERSHELFQPLPPTYELRISGVPGYQASICYSISVVVNKWSILPRVNLFSKTLGYEIVTTSFLYSPRTQPIAPLPPRMAPSSLYGVFVVPEWELFESNIRAKAGPGHDVNVKVCNCLASFYSELKNSITQLYLPVSRTFCIKQAIPFHVVFRSSTISLAGFKSFGPSRTDSCTSIKLLRKSTIDARSIRSALRLLLLTTSD